MQHGQLTDFDQIDHQSEGCVVPIPHVQEAMDKMQYASTERVMFEMLYYSGGRLTCLDRMYVDHLYGEWLYWQPGKNQHGWRKIRLPPEYLEELRVYREHHRVKARQLFGVTGETFRGYFKNFVRPRLPSAWQRKKLHMTTDGPRMEYVLQLRGLRKNWQTLDFQRNLEDLGDPGMAIEKTSKHMCHSSFKITARHYVENVTALGVKDLHTLDPIALLKMRQQTRLLDFAPGLVQEGQTRKKTLKRHLPQRPF